MRRLLLSILGFALCLMVLESCNKGPAMVGTWTTSAGTYTFNPDNTFKFELSKSGVTISASGTYTEADPKVTVTPTKADVSTTDPKISAVLGQIKEKAQSQMNKEQDATITWSGKDAFSLQGTQGPAQSFTRKQ